MRRRTIFVAALNFTDGRYKQEAEHITTSHFARGINLVCIIKTISRVFRRQHGRVLVLAGRQRVRHSGAPAVLRAALQLAPAGLVLVDSSSVAA